MNIFIDADTGTYGIADELYILYVNEEADIGDLLESLNEGELSIIAKAFGLKVIHY